MPASPALLDALAVAVGDPAQVRTRAIDRHALGSDASHFLLTPQVVVIAGGADDVGRLMSQSAQAGVPLTLRSGGTSLSGQGVTDGILVDVRTRFRDIEVLDNGARVRVQPGVTVRQANARLLRYGTRLGPDPASEIACTVGGVIANNSSGMVCGTTENSYATVQSLVVVLPSGAVVDTGARDADERLHAREPELAQGLLRLRDRVRGDAASTSTIRRQFAMKNTMGYGVNAFLDFDRAIDILRHLMIGSEGTLGFVAEVTFRTVPLKQHASSALAIFPSLAAANRALPALVESGAATLELMDATSLRVGQALPDAPRQIAGLVVDTQAALLVEYQSTRQEHLAELVAAGTTTLAGLDLLTPAELSTDAAARATLWKLRKGLFTSVAGARASGTTALLEDIVVPVPALAETCEELGLLFDRYGYRDSVIFGHAKDGNVHFMLTDRFESPEQVARYRGFTDDMVDLVLGQGGSLKAEHGTGRVMAPYVRRQYGDELYDVMRAVKRLFDPSGMLNPGVILDDDPDAHLRHIKLNPVVEEEVDRCVECGYCEPVCPSRDLTLTPRQRIVLRRSIVTAENNGDAALVRELEDDYEYSAVQTCAVDGMCQTACPVLINTGDLVKRLRKADSNPVERAAWTTAAKQWGAVTRVGSVAMGVATALPTPLVRAVTDVGRAVLGTDTVPRWSAELPGGGRARARPSVAGQPTAVYLPACVNSMFGAADGGPGVQWSFEQLCERVGIRLLVPEGIESLCCGTPWSSKGFPGGYEVMRERVAAAVDSATRGGELTVVSDASSCTEGYIGMLRSAGLAVTVVDAVQFVAERVLPLLPEGERIGSLTLHPTCSSTQLGANAALAELGNAVADEVHIPVDWGCCAFAGDRGMLHPELTASATAAEAREVAALGSEAHASCNRTCELGMTRATGEQYRHVIELLEEVTRAVEL